MPRMFPLVISAVLTVVGISAASPDNGTSVTEERYRPQFHFTAEKNWLNDPNGCVFYDGEYHLFFQHNPKGNEWGNMTWGHAVSDDLLHWKQLPNAIEPYGDGTIFSGTAVVDERNTAGFQTGPQKTLAAMFTHATKSAGQALAYSNDKGRTWKLYNEGRHVVPNQGLDPCERDPKVFWHEPTRKWIMVLWVKTDGRVRFFTSTDLKSWEKVSDFVSPGLFECPDFFELAIDGNQDRKMWVLYDAAFNYWLGTFDGRTFESKVGPTRGDFGKNFYAAQTWNNVPDRRIQIGWMRDGKYPGMSFNQQMSFPCELELRTTSEGLRLCRTPIKEIARLCGQSNIKEGWNCKADEVLPMQLFGEEYDEDEITTPSDDLFDFEVTFEPKQASEFHIGLQGETIAWSGGKVSCLGTTASLPLKNGAVTLRLLVDRTSIELFGNNGELSMSSCFLPKTREPKVNFTSKGGDVVIREARLTELKSARLSK